MASKYEEKLKSIAMEPDEDKRLEMAAALDGDVSELDERWDNRDGYTAIEQERDGIKAELDSTVAERDEWKKRYADRFFDPVEGETDDTKVISKHKQEARRESRQRGYAALWEDME